MSTSDPIPTAPEASEGAPEQEHWATWPRRAAAGVLALVGLSIVVVGNVSGEPAGARIAVSLLGLGLALGFGWVAWRSGRRPVVAFGPGHVRLWTGPALRDEAVASVRVRQRRAWLVVVTPAPGTGAGGIAPLGLLRWEDRFAVRDELRRRYEHDGVTFQDGLA